MYNTKFVLVDGNEVYPGYFDTEKRRELQIKNGDSRGYMWCGCLSDRKLFYRISEDLKIYPEHNLYEHNINCSRYKTKDGKSIRKTAYVVDDETGEVTAYLTFNPKNLSADKNEEEKETTGIIIDEQEDSEEVIIEKDADGDSKKKETKEPKLSLSSLVRSINIDTYTEKVLNGMSISSKDVFAKQVYYRMKKVKVSRMKKSIGDLTLENDGVRFIYLPYAGAVKKTDKGLTKCYFATYGLDGKEYNNFVFPETMEKTLKEFEKVYGILPDENTMLAAFQYYKKGRSGVRYKVLGRVHLFQVSNVGIYSRNMVEQETYNSICKIVKDNTDLKFYIPADDESIGGIIKVKNKEKKLLLLFRTDKPERITYDINMYEPFVSSNIEPITIDRFYKRVEEMS